MRNLKKKWKRLLALLVAMALILVDFPITNIMNVSANNTEGDITIESVIYKYEDEEEQQQQIEFDKSTEGNTYEKYMNITLPDSINVEITLESENEIQEQNVSLYDGETPVDILSMNDKTITCAITKDKLYTIKVNDTEIGTVTWSQDTEAPNITKVTDITGNTQYQSEDNIIASGTTIRVYLEDANLNILKVDDTDDVTDTDIVSEIKTEEVEEVQYFYYEYTIPKTDTYTFVAEDKAGNSNIDNPTSMKFTIDTEGPTISKVVDATSTENLEIVYYEFVGENGVINYVIGDSVNLKIYVSDDDVSSISYMNGQETITNSEVKTDTNIKYFECNNIPVGNIEFKLSDNLGNNAIYTYKFVKIVNPTINNIYGKDDNNNDVDFIVNSENANYIEDGTVTFYIEAAKGNSSELAGIKFSKTNDFNAIDATIITDNSNSVYTVTLNNIQENDMYYFWAYDGAGNVSETKTVKFTLDSTTVKILDVNILEKDFKYTLEITFDSGVSGIKSISAKCGENTINPENITVNNGIYYISNLSYWEISKKFEFTIVKNTINASSNRCYYSMSDKGLIVTSSVKEWINSSDINNNELNKINLALKWEEGKSGNVKSISYKIIDSDRTELTEGTITANSNLSYTIDFGNLFKNNNGVDDYYLVKIDIQYTYYNNWGNEKTANIVNEVYVNVDRENPTFSLNESDFNSDYINVSEVSDLVISSLSDSFSGINSEGIKVELCDANSNILSDLTSSVTTNSNTNNKEVKLSDVIKNYMDTHDLKKDSYIIKVTVSDIAGNKSSDTVSVNIDNSGVDFKSNINNYEGWVNINKENPSILQVSDIKVKQGSQIGSVSVIIKNKTTNESKVIFLSESEESGIYELNLTELLTAASEEETPVLVNGQLYELSVCVKSDDYDEDNNYAYTYKIHNVDMGIDNEAPTELKVNTTYDGDWTKQSIQVSATFQEAESDVKVYYYMYNSEQNPTKEDIINNGNELENGVIVAPSSKDNNGTEFTEEKLIELSGKYTVKFCAVDEAGNISDIAELYNNETVKTYNVDISKPIIDVKVNEAPVKIINGIRWYNDNITVSYKLENKFSNLDLVGLNGILEGNSYSILASKDSDNTILNSMITTNRAGKDPDGDWTVKFEVLNKTNGKKNFELSGIAIDTKSPKLNAQPKVTANKYIDSVYTSKDTVTIQGKATDNILSGIEGSGIDKIELVDSTGKVLNSVTSAEEYKFEIKNAGTYTGLKIKVTDKVGHATNSEPFNVLIATANTDITPTYEDGSVTVNGKKFYSKNTNVTFSVANKNNAGLDKVVVDINGTQVYSDSDISKSKKTSSVSFKVNTKDATINNKDNSYKIKVTATDNAGNTSERTITVYKDNKKPSISEFKFGDETGVQKVNYGYFFTKNTDVTIMAADQTEGSGLESISFYTISKDGTKSKIETVTTNSTATFTVKAGFKGQIYAYATDKVGNESNNEYRLAGTIIETKEKHLETSAITFNTPSTSYKDINGKPLYNRDVAVTIKIEDTFSGIESVSWKVLSNDETADAVEGSIEVNNKGEITGDIDNLTDSVNELNLVTAVNKKLVIKDNSNNIKVEVTLKDNAGHKSTKTLVFSIDKTTPTVNVTYNNIAPDNGNMFNANRVATITVTERNFNSKDVELNITNTDGDVPHISLWEKVDGNGNGDNTVHRATLTFSEDGDYEFDVKYADRAANKTTANFGNAVAPNEFTIDKTNPTMTVVYDNNAVANGNFYQDSRTATLSINEHNFDAGRVEVTIRENGKEVNKPVSNWTNNGDNHTATVTFNTEGEFAITATCQDMAGNTLQNAINDTFIIDTEDPTMLITGVENNVAYNAETVGVTVTAADKYFDSLNVVLLKLDSEGNSEQVVLNGVDIANGKEYSITNLTDDAVYTLESTVKDKSGKTVTDSRMFSVNRKGSTFAITDKDTVSMKNSYINQANDIVICETNVNRLNIDSISVMIYKNSEAIELVKGKDFEIEIEEEAGKWCKYTYIIKKENFTDDAVYKVAIYSEDMADNVALSESDDKDAGFGFVVDNTKPICNVYDLKANTTYGVDSKKVEFMPEDNIELSSVVVLLNGKEVMNVSGKDLKNLIESVKTYHL